VPEFIDPVFTKTSPKRSFSLNRKRAYWLVFAKTGSIISGTGVGFKEFFSSCSNVTHTGFTVSWESSPCALGTQLMVKVKIFFIIGTLPLRTVAVGLKKGASVNQFERNTL
jgi:hypothetical protein